MAPTTWLLSPSFSVDPDRPLIRSRHIVTCLVFHLVDDWGWANAGWHANPQNEKEVHTPRMDALVKEGIELCVPLLRSPTALARSLKRMRVAEQ